MSAELLSFEDFELDRNAYQLRCKGQPVRLERIPLDLLFLLAERRGQLLTRQEIFDQIWGKGIFLDSDSAINTAIRKIRQALGDDAEAPRFVVTVPSKGYRFVATVREASALHPPPRPSQSPFIGRERELTILRQGLESAVSGGGGCMFLICGAPGVGKTRLSRELVDRAHVHRMRILSGNCREQDEPLPYLPFVEVLEACINGAADNESLRTLLGEQASELSRLLPGLKRTMPDLAPPLELPPAQARRHLFNSCCDFIARLARERPALLILDDLHWADDSSLALLSHLAKRISDLPVLVVGTYRDVESDQTHGLAKTLEELLRERIATTIRLKGLPPDEVALMLQALSGKAPPESVTLEIHAETQGNPFFIEELFRYLEEENRLYDAAGQFRPRLKVDELEVPHGVRLVVGRRMARLTDSTRKMLATAAAIGRSFALRVLEAANEGDSVSLPGCVEEAEKAGLILSFAEGLEQRVEFSHELVRQAVLREISAARRQQLHLQVARAIERIFPDATEEHPGELAHHYRFAGNWRKAAEYLWHHGIQAQQRSAYVEAIASLTRGIEILKKLPDDDERARLELTMQRGLASLWWTLREAFSPQSRAAMERTLELCERVGDSIDRFAAIDFLRASYALGLEIRKACDLAERELALAEQEQDPTMLAIAHVAGMGDAMLQQGRFAAAREHIEKGLAIPIGRSLPPPLAFWAAWAPGPGQSLLAWDLWILGYPQQALERVKQAVAAATNESIPFWRSSGMYYALRVYVCLRHPDTLGLASSLSAYIAEHRLSFLGRIAPLFMGWARAQRGESVRMPAPIDRIPPDYVIPTWTVGLMIELGLKTGQIAEALALIAHALLRSEQTGERIWLAELHRMKGELILTREPANVADAESCFRTAVDVAREQQAKSLELRATASLARLLRDTGRRDDALAMLAEIYGWFTEGFETRDLKDAKALLDELSK